MNKNITKVLTTQFLTAFADNAVLFTAVTMALKQLDKASWYVPALQASFLVAFVILAPLVGNLADIRAKPKILFFGNIIKALGAGMLFINIEPLLSYAVIGLGAAIYSPAKYGILPEMVDKNLLVKANGYIESSTILAILGGSLLGAMISEYSINLSLFVIILLYVISAWAASTINHKFIAKSQKQVDCLSFLKQMQSFLLSPRARFATLGVSLFWASATVLRVLLVAWAPVVLFIHSTTDIAVLTMYTAVGIAVGSIMVPRLIPLAYLRRARIAAYMMGVVIVLMSTISNHNLVQLCLFLAGVCGGLFVVPMNAALQKIGQMTIGSGKAVAIQNFFENLAMLIASAIYSFTAAINIDPVLIMTSLGFFIVVLTALVSWHLPDDNGNLLEKAAQS